MPLTISHFRISRTTLPSCRCENIQLFFVRHRIMGLVSGHVPHRLNYSKLAKVSSACLKTYSLSSFQLPLDISSGTMKEKRIVEIYMYK